MVRPAFHGRYVGGHQGIDAEPIINQAGKGVIICRNAILFEIVIEITANDPVFGFRRLKTLLDNPTNTQSFLLTDMARFIPPAMH